ncbi:lysozyme-like [Lytechinus variegatus]|uniref:lysozyme-like n=1 Tax=Lytechinus variegatus TaxID=7654 RepID=UPI001BB13501|nr:lysozyme-like [Lytechinus variegatus]
MAVSKTLIFCVVLFIVVSCKEVFPGSGKRAGNHGQNAKNVILPTPVPSDCLKCICIVESGCKMPNPLCQVDVGSLSCGPYQLKQDYWNDAKFKGGDLDGSWRKCSADFGCSGDAVQGYMARYAVERRLGHIPTCEDFARIHNGGPDGFNKTSTLKYWARVKECLQ